MARCELDVRLRDDRKSYRPGDKIEGDVHVRVDKNCRCRALRLELRWESYSGWGESRAVQRAVLFSGRWTAGERHVFPFSFVAPSSPLTLRHELVRIGWSLTAVADLSWARDPAAFQYFSIGYPEDPPPAPLTIQDHLLLPAKSPFMAELAPAVASYRDLPADGAWDLRLAFVEIPSGVIRVGAALTIQGEVHKEVSGSQSVSWVWEPFVWYHQQIDLRPDKRGFVGRFPRWPHKERKPWPFKASGVKVRWTLDVRLRNEADNVLGWGQVDLPVRPDV